jgi:ribosomal protein S12 methylthiotransferase accessory factor
VTGVRAAVLEHARASLPLSSSEHPLPPEHALGVASSVAFREGLTLDLALADAVEDSLVVRCALKRNGETVDRSTGKGRRVQALASAAFEALEHAAARAKLSGSATPDETAVLIPRPFSQPDLVYDFASRISQPQKVTRFTRLAGDGPTTLLYPSAARDSSFRFQKGQDDKFAIFARFLTTNGYAAGLTVEDARVHALNEILERDAVSQYLLDSVLGRPGAKIVSPRGAEVEPLLAGLGEVTANGIQLVWLPSLAGTAVMARAEVPADGNAHKGYAVAGFGCSNSADVAVERAVTELHQEIVAHRVDPSGLGDGGVPLSNLDSYPLLREMAEIPSPPEDADVVSYEAFLRQADDGHSIIERLESLRISIYSRDVWTSFGDEGFGVAVVQVIAPGLENLYALQLGWPIVPTGRLWTPSATRRLLHTG